MDKQAIETTVAFNNLRAGGEYLSERVKNIVEGLGQLTEEEKKEFFKDHFNLAWDMADRLTSDPRYSDKELAHDLDLGDQGLGQIYIRQMQDTEEPAIKGITLQIPGWGENEVYALIDGSFHEDDGISLDDTIVEMLDILETLAVAEDSLSRSPIETTLR